MATNKEFVQGLADKYGASYEDSDFQKLEEYGRGANKYREQQARGADADWTGPGFSTPDQYENFKKDLEEQYKQRGGNKPRGEDTNNPGPSNNLGPSNNGPSNPSGNNSSYTSPSQNDNRPSYEQYDSRAAEAMNRQTALMEQMFAQQKSEQAANNAKRDTLFGTMMDRSKANLDFDRTDPIIRRQADAFNANTTRSTRDYLSDTAEQNGPLANMQGERRIANEKAGIAGGNFEAELMGRELQTRRAEIVDALNSMRGILTADQQQAMQQQIALLDNNIKQQQLGQSQFGLDTARTLGMGGLEAQLLGLNNQNSQYYAGLNSQNDQFGAKYNFDVTDRAAYWDAIRSGRIKG